MVVKVVPRGPCSPDLGAPTVVPGVDESVPWLVESVEPVLLVMWAGDTSPVEVGGSLTVDEAEGMLHIVPGADTESDLKNVINIFLILMSHCSPWERDFYHIAI